MRKAFITGTAGFIGFHLARRLLETGWQVLGYDGMTEYYDVTLKRQRHNILGRFPEFSAVEAMLEDHDRLCSSISDFRPDIVVHLAAQAGVRYSLEAPRSYVETNIVGTFNILEAVRESSVQHLLLASTSSVYGANTKMPYAETDKADHQLTIYAASKKACEAISHAYSHLHQIPTTAFRFFTVYGPWGRPDMAYFKFTKAILEGAPIDIYNFGDMRRDFTYVDDLVKSIALLIDVPPPRGSEREGLPTDPQDTLSPIAPWRVVNIGNAEPIQLMDFVRALEVELGRTALYNMMPMQPGDVQATWADVELLTKLTGYSPNTRVRDGVRAFADWYRGFYGKDGGV